MRWANAPTVCTVVCCLLASELRLVERGKYAAARD